MINKKQKHATRCRCSCTTGRLDFGIFPFVVFVVAIIETSDEEPNVTLAHVTIMVPKTDYRRCVKVANHHYNNSVLKLHISKLGNTQNPLVGYIFR